MDIIDDFLLEIRKIFHLTATEISELRPILKDYHLTLSEIRPFIISEKFIDFTQADLSNPQDIISKFFIYSTNEIQSILAGYKQSVSQFNKEMRDYDKRVFIAVAVFFRELIKEDKF